MVVVMKKKGFKLHILFHVARHVWNVDSLTFIDSVTARVRYFAKLALFRKVMEKKSVDK